MTDAEDSRVWQRNLEREREGLRERVRELEAAINSQRVMFNESHKVRGELQRERDEFKATCANQRKELHTLNVERRKTLTQLEDAQRRIAELEARLQAHSKADPAFTLSPSERSVVDYVRGSFDGHDPQHTRTDVVQLLSIVDRATSHSKAEPAERKTQEECSTIEIGVLADGALKEG